MNKAVALMLLALELSLSGCSASPTSTVKAADGIWESALAGTDAGVAVFNFVTSFSIGADGSLSVSSVSFLTGGPCFPVTGATASGSFDVISAAIASTTANFQFMVQSGDNSLALTGTATGTTDSSNNTTWNSITGTWISSGDSSCAGSGTFTMTRS
jgi:hypothetical protein